MKKLLSKFKKYTFWVAFVGVFVLFLQNLAKALGYEIDTTNIESAIMSFCGVLVVLGVVSKDSAATTIVGENSDTLKCDKDAQDLNIICEPCDVKNSSNGVENENKCSTVDVLSSAETDEVLGKLVENKIDDYVIVEPIDDNTSEEIFVENVEDVESKLAEESACSDSFRDQTCDQIVIEGAGQSDTENQTQYTKLCDLEKLCKDCPFRQKSESAFEESSLCDNMQNSDTEPCSIDSGDYDIPEIDATQKITFDPTYSCFE